MFEHKLTQAKLADLLHVGKPKLSRILNGKTEPDVPFIKSIYKELGIDAKTILDVV